METCDRCGRPLGAVLDGDASDGGTEAVVPGQASGGTEDAVPPGQAAIVVEPVVERTEEALRPSGEGPAPAEQGEPEWRLPPRPARAHAPPLLPSPVRRDGSAERRGEAWSQVPDLAFPEPLPPDPGPRPPIAAGPLVRWHRRTRAATRRAAAGKRTRGSRLIRSGLALGLVVLGLTTGPAGPIPAAAFVVGAAILAFGAASRAFGPPGRGWPP